MPNQNAAKPDHALTRVGDRLFEALTQQEIAHLLNAVFAVLSPELRDRALDQLQPDTRQTVEHILAPPKIAAGTEASQAKSVSIAKLEQTWSNLWAEWEGIVAEAAQEDGPYMTQEAHWEPPYFDQTAFIEDLERVAGKMRPLVQSAFQNSFLPDMGFAQALSEAEDEIAAAMPDWITIDDGFYICLLAGVYHPESQTTYLGLWISPQQRGVVVTLAHRKHRRSTKGSPLVSATNGAVAGPSTRRGSCIRR